MMENKTEEYLQELRKFSIQQDKSNNIWHLIKKLGIQISRKIVLMKRRKYNQTKLTQKCHINCMCKNIKAIVRTVFHMFRKLTGKIKHVIIYMKDT